MNDLVFRAVAAGILFGIWPLLMSRSNLGGTVSATAFALGVLLCLFPFALKEGIANTSSVRWTLVVLACITGAAALWFFNGMLAKASPDRVALLFVLCLVAQIVAPAIWQVIVTKSLSPSRALGFVAAIVAAKLLS